MKGGNRWNHGGGGRGKAVHRALGSSEQPAWEKEGIYYSPVRSFCRDLACSKTSSVRRCSSHSPPYSLYSPFASPVLFRFNAPARCS